MITRRGTTAAPPAVVATKTTRTTTAPKAQAFTDMQKNMEAELEQRRLDWEREIGDMQKDFFNMDTEPKANNNGVSSEGPVKVGVRNVCHLSSVVVSCRRRRRRCQYDSFPAFFQSPRYSWSIMTITIRNNNYNLSCSLSFSRAPQQFTRHERMFCRLLVVVTVIVSGDRHKIVDVGYIYHGW